MILGVLRFYCRGCIGLPLDFWNRGMYKLGVRHVTLFFYSLCDFSWLSQLCVLIFGENVLMFKDVLEVLEASVSG